MSDEKYEKILELIESHEERLSKIEDLLFSEKVPVPQIKDRILEEIAKGFDSSIEKIQRLVDVEQDDFSIITSIPGETQAERQINSALLILTISHFGYNQDAMKSPLLKDKLGWLGISFNNFSKSMRTIQGKVLPRGKPRSIDFEYKITITGLEEAKKNFNTIFS